MNCEDEKIIQSLFLAMAVAGLLPDDKDFKEEWLEDMAKDAARYRHLKKNYVDVADEYGRAEQLYFGTYSAGDLDRLLDDEMG